MFARSGLDMSPEETDENKQLVDDMYAGLNRNRLGIMNEYWHEDMVWNGPTGIGVKHGITDFEENYRRDFIAAFPDKYAEDIVRVAEGDWGGGYRVPGHDLCTGTGWAYRLPVKKYGYVTWTSGVWKKSHTPANAN